MGAGRRAGEHTPRVVAPIGRRRLEAWQPPATSPPSDRVTSGAAPWPGSAHGSWERPCRLAARRTLPSRGLARRSPRALRAVTPSWRGVSRKEGLRYFYRGQVIQGGFTSGRRWGPKTPVSGWEPELARHRPQNRSTQKRIPGEKEFVSDPNHIVTAKIWALSVAVAARNAWGRHAATAWRSQRSPGNPWENWFFGSAAGSAAVTAFRRGGPGGSRGRRPRAWSS